MLKTDLLASLAVPIDGGARWRGRPVFGANKTWRGVALMTGFTALASASQAAVARRYRWSAPLHLQQSARVNAWLAGAISGLTYCLAELPNSFAKRRLGISPGMHVRRHSWLQYTIDQADSVVGCMFPLRLIYRSEVAELLTALGLGMGIHIGIDQLIYAIGVKSRATTT